MSDDDEFDELPPISVYASRGESVFAMPSAEVVASQRARDERLERELRSLLEGEAEAGAPLKRSDSSESEGEEALAAAVNALLVEPATRSRPRPEARILLSTMLAVLSPSHPRLLQDFLDAADHIDPPALEALTYEIARTLSDMVSASEESWADDEVLSAGTWLAAALLWAHPPAPRLLAARTLRTLLCDCCDARQVDMLAEVCRSAFPQWSARLELYDAVVGAGEGSGGSRFARALLSAALDDVLGVQLPATTQTIVAAIAGKWRGEEASAQLAAVRLIGRAIARGDFPARPTLDAFAPPPTRTVPTAHTLERLKVRLELAELRCLFTPNGADGDTKGRGESGAE